MSDERGVLRQISWRDVCPWLLIFRTFRLSIRLPILFLATCGVILSSMGWNVAQRAFLSEQTLRDDPELRLVVNQQSQWPKLARDPQLSDDVPLPFPLQSLVPNSPGDIATVFRSYIEPYTRLLRPGPLPLVKCAYWSFGALWMLVVWSLIGGIITRMAVVQLGRDEQIDLRSAARFTVQRWRSLIIAPLFPLVGVLLVVVFSALLGLLMRTNLGMLFGGAVWGLVLIGGLVTTVFLVGLLFGWPLMWGAISAEESGDEFEAFHRTYSYTYQRPLQFLFYGLVAALFGGLCWYFVEHFSMAVTGYSSWAVSWGTGWPRWQEIEQSVVTGEAESGLMRWGANLYSLWQVLVACIVVGFRYAFFWSVAAAIYLLLRRDVDQTEFDEVFVEDEPPPYTLPPLTTDSADAPPPAENPASPSETGETAPLAGS